MFRDRTEVMLDKRGPGPGRGPILTLIPTKLHQSLISSFQFLHSHIDTHMQTDAAKTIPDND